VVISFFYTGDQNKFVKRNFEDFLIQDLETFFGQNSIVRENNKQTFLGKTQVKLASILGNSKLTNSEINSENSFKNQLKNLKTTKKLGNINSQVKKEIKNEVEIWKNGNEIESKNIDNLVRNFGGENLAKIKNSQIESILKSGKNNGENNFWQNILKNEVKTQAHAGESHRTLTEAEQHEAEERLEVKEKAEIERKNNQANSQKLNLSSQNSQNSIDRNSSGKSEEELKKINNLLGNVVIFVQPNEPTSEQVKAKFDKLIPLGDSVCGG